MLVVLITAGVQHAGLFKPCLWGVLDFSSHVCGECRIALAVPRPGISPGCPTPHTSSTCTEACHAACRGQPGPRHQGRVP